MIVIPAIDLKDHQVVRLSQGNMGKAKVYSDNPIEIAKKWIEAGAKRLHLVDLNGAFEGKPVHFKEIESIACAFPKVQLEIGGGIRDLKTVQAYFKSGVTHCILGTAVLKDPAFAMEASDKFPGKIILGLDAKNGTIAVEGWDKSSRVKATDLVLRFKDKKIAEIIYTDISRDGMMQGMNFQAIKKMANTSPFPIIASGGFTRLEEIKTLKKIPNVSGVIAGKALYEGLVDLKEAIRFAVNGSCRPQVSRSRPRPEGAGLRLDRAPNIMLFKRIIPCLDVKEGRVVKGVKFVGLKDAGDPVEIAKRYDDEGADELIFLDITASHEKRKIILDVVEKTASRVFMPLTVGGGVRTMEDIRNLLNAGADKVSINTAAVERPELVKEASEKFGSQCIVVAIDAKRVDRKKNNHDSPSTIHYPQFTVFTHGGRTPTGLDAIAWAKKMENYGAGEILLTSMDRDGTKMGYDIELTRTVVDATTIPVIASGGVGTLEHLYEGLTTAKAEAVLAASIFHYQEFTVKEAKEYLAHKGVPIRLIL